MPHDLRKYAVHESSHAIFHWVNSGRLISVTISRDGLNNTTLLNHPVFKVLHKISFDHAALKSWVTGLLAGVAGEMHLTNELWQEVPTFLEDDIRLAMQAMKSRGWIPPIGYTCNQFFKNFGYWARVFTVSRWPEIMLLADLLESKLQLSGKDCARFLEEIWPESLPAGILPWDQHGKT